MKICISSTGKDMNSQIDPKFGRCTYFLIIQTDDMSIEVFENEYKSLGGGAGIQSAGFVHSKGVKTVLTGNCGPNAMKVFAESKIQVVTGQAGLIKDALEKFKNGELTPSSIPNVEEKAGMSAAADQGNFGPQGQGCGKGSGCGRGVGGGRGMGGGGGRGMGGGGGRGRGQS